MRNYAIPTWLAAAAVCSMTAASLLAQGSKPAAQPAPATPAKPAAPAAPAKPDASKPAVPAMPGMDPVKMAEMEKLGTPGPEHKRLDPMVGTWSCDVKMWMKPGDPPMPMKGEAKIAWIMGGRFLQEDVVGDEMSPGQKFLGRSTVGYDNAKKQYVMSWIDNESTAITTGAGSWDAAKNALSWMAEGPDPDHPGKTRKTREVITFASPTNLLLESFAPGPDGKEFKQMEITYTKK